MTELVICYATADGAVARLLAYGRGDGSLRDENHVRDIARCFAKGNEEDVVCRPPAPGERVLFEITLGVSRSRRGTSRYSGWDYRRIEPCPMEVAQEGMLLFRKIKSNLRKAARSRGASMRIGGDGR